MSCGNLKTEAVEKTNTKRNPSNATRTILEEKKAPDERRDGLRTPPPYMHEIDAAVPTPK
jgi:hypothetical protein